MGLLFWIIFLSKALLDFRRPLWHRDSLAFRESFAHLFLGQVPTQGLSVQGQRLRVCFCFVGSCTMHPYSRATVIRLQELFCCFAWTSVERIQRHSLDFLLRLVSSTRQGQLKLKHFAVISGFTNEFNSKVKALTGCFSSFWNIINWSFCKTGVVVGTRYF